MTTSHAREREARIYFNKPKSRARVIEHEAEGWDQHHITSNSRIYSPVYKLGYRSFIRTGSLKIQKGLGIKHVEYKKSNLKDSVFCSTKRESELNKYFIFTHTPR